VAAEAVVQRFGQIRLVLNDQYAVHVPEYVKNCM
jgi:hypothetical protein